MKLNRFLLLAASTSLELVDFRPENFNLPTDYTFTSNFASWGSFIVFGLA